MTVHDSDSHTANGQPVSEATAGTPGALHGLRILDLTRVVAGPYATMLLADHGAEVIKVEQPGNGDETRTFPPFSGGESTYFMSLNRNKKSVELDLKSEADYEQMLRLVETSDVVMHNFRPAFIRARKLDHGSLSARNPRIVSCAISGFSNSGPYCDQPAYDLFVAGLGGLMSVTGEPDGPPQRPGISLVDYMTGLQAALGTMVALQAVHATGRGQLVEVSMLSTLLSVTGVMVGAWAVSGVVPGPGSHNQSAQMVPYGTFAAADGYVNVGVIKDKFWIPLCPIIGHPEWRDDPRFVTNPDRVANRDELLALLRPIFAQQTCEHWITALQDADIPCGPILTFDQVIDDPEVRASGMFQTIDHPTAGPTLVAGPPVRMSATPASLRTPPPRLGEHSEQFLNADTTR